MRDMHLSRGFRLLGIFSVLGSCQGVIDPLPDPSASSGGGSGTGGETSDAAGAKPEGAGPWPLRRLTNREYDNTVRDQLLIPFRGIDLEADAPGDTGFTTAGDVKIGRAHV